MSGLIYTLLVYLKVFFEKVNFEKKSSDDKKSMQNYPVFRELNVSLTSLYVNLNQHYDNKLEHNCSAVSLTLCMLGSFAYLFLSSAEILQSSLFQKILSGLPS